MAKKTVCDFCLKEYTGMFNKPERLHDGHHICKDCRKIIESYGMRVQFDLFQTLVTAAPNMRSTIMNTYLENHKPEECIAKFYPLPQVQLHSGEHCINAIPATITVAASTLPEKATVQNIAEVKKKNIQNISDATSRSDAKKISGTLYETEAAIYFLSPNFVNCHRLGYALRNRPETNRIIIKAPTQTFTYEVAHSDLFFLRERFFQKVVATMEKKNEHLIYIQGENEFTVTPGIYDINKVLRPGIYKVKAIRDAGLHMRDAQGKVTDYYENEEYIDLSEGGILEATGEYQLEWMGKDMTHLRK